MATLQEIVRNPLLLVEPILLDEPIDLVDVPTPALTIDLNAFESNLNKMQQYVEARVHQGCHEFDDPITGCRLCPVGCDSTHHHAWLDRYRHDCGEPQ